MATNAPQTLADLAERFGLELRGDGAVAITGVGTLGTAKPGQLAFLANPRYRSELADTHAAAVVLRAADADASPAPSLIATDPYVAFAKIAALFDPRRLPAPGIHASAAIDAGARIDPGAHVGAFVSIGARSVVEAGAIVGPGCVIGEDCVIGVGCELVARVTLVTRVRLGKRVRIHPGAVLGADGFGLAKDAGRWIKVPQLGGVAVGDDCEIGANTTIDRGALEDTVLEEDVRLDNLIQIGHNVRIGAHTAMAGCVGVAGSTKIGRNCLIAGAAGINGHIEICDNVVIHAASVVLHSIAAPGEYSSGTPLLDHRSWRRNMARYKQLDDFARKLNALSRDSEQ